MFIRNIWAYMNGIIIRHFQKAKQQSFLGLVGELGTRVNRRGQIGLPGSLHLRKGIERTDNGTLLQLITNLTLGIILGAELLALQFRYYLVYTSISFQNTLWHANQNRKKNKLFPKQISGYICAFNHITLMGF